MGVAGGVGVQEEEQKKEDEARSNFYRASVVLLHIDNRHTTHTSTLIEKKREREKGEGGREAHADLRTVSPFGTHKGNRLPLRQNDAIIYTWLNTQEKWKCVEASATDKGAFVLRHTHTHTHTYTYICTYIHNIFIYQFYILVTPASHFLPYWDV